MAKSAKKSTALDLALDILKSKSTVTPAEINAYVGKGNYASKYVLYLKLAGHDIVTNKTGRTVVSYGYVGLNLNVDTSVKASDRRASKLLTGKATKTVAAPTVVKSEPKAPKAVKHVKVVKEKASAKQVMTKDEIAKATAAIVALREKSAKIATEKVLTAPVAASSFNVDPDWDAGVEDVRSLLG
jgi:hypothetical protein